MLIYYKHLRYKYFQFLFQIEPPFARTQLIEFSNMHTFHQAGLIFWPGALTLRP
jgi:hypothetical protein